MDYYRFGTCAGMDAPGGVLLGLMGKLSTPAGTAPERLLLVAGHMNGGLRAAPALHVCEFLVHVLDGSVLTKVGAEEARLIADTTVRIPAGTPYQFSTERSGGMTALVIVPQPGDTSLPALRLALPACCGDVLRVLGDPHPMERSSFDILCSLTRLTSDGCVLASVEMAKGNVHRGVIIASLLPQYAADPRALRAFIWTCNAHPAAFWWLDRKRVQRSIEEGVAKLLSQ